MLFVFIVMCHVLKNVNQSDFAMFVVILKILLQIWFRKNRSLGTLAISLDTELLTLILQFIKNSDHIILCYLYLRINIFFGGGVGVGKGGGCEILENNTNNTVFLSLVEESLKIF